MLLAFVLFSCAGAQLYEGDSCVDGRTGTGGMCCLVNVCQSARDDLRSGIKPSLCSFSGMNPVVCCRYGCATTAGVTPPPTQPVTWATNPNQPTMVTKPAKEGESGQISTRKSQAVCASYEVIQAATEAPAPRPIFVKLNSTEAVNFTLFNNNLRGQRTRRQSSTPLATTDDEDDGFVHIAVVGGKDAKVDEFPHMAAVGWPLKDGSYAFNCGGSLISERWVLTAGHCLSNARDTSVVSSDPTVVRLGDQNILDNVVQEGAPIDVQIDRRVKHPSYRPPSKYYDIALLGLKDSVAFSAHIRPACLWTEEGFGAHATAVVTGWGTTVSGGKKGSEVLQKVKLDLLDTNTCDGLLKSARNRNWQGFRDHQLCAGVLVGGKDACQGDSGGPLQVKTENAGGSKYYVMGITSFGRDCAKPNLPGVYTRVSAFVDWIEDVVWT